MSEISAAMVMELRKISGQGMMDCKKALQEADGNVEQAMDILRKKGLATLAKRAQRDTSEGIVILTEGENWASLATLCCETDFVAKSDDFVATVDYIKNYVEKCEADSGPDAILETEIDGKKGSDVVTETISKTGEKMVIGDYQRFHISKTGVIGTYIHFNGKVGAMVEIEANDETTAASNTMKQIANDIAMHITATKPRALDRDGREAESDWPREIEREKAIFIEQVKNKPENIVEKIVEGKMQKFYKENCLLEQPFVKDDSKTIEQVLVEAAKQVSGQAKIKRFVRFEVG